jgi:hypothetical protein
LSPENIYFHPPFYPFPGGEIPYKLDQNLRYRSEPGCDDGPKAFPWDESWNEPEPWDRDPVNLQPSLFDQYVNDINEIGLDDGEGSPYVQPLAQVRIPEPSAMPIFDMKSELSIIKRCRTAVASLYGMKTGSIYYAPMKCDRFWCPECGGRHGFIHERRKNSAYTKMNHGRLPKNRAERRKAVRGWLVGQGVFTVPADVPEKLMTREGVNEIFGAAKRTMKHFEPDTNMVAGLQVCGDKHPENLHIHTHVLTFHPRGEHPRLRITPERLASVKDIYAQELRAIGFEGVRGPGEAIEGKLVDVHYNFEFEIGKVLHLVNYATRPLGAEHLKAWQESEKGQEMIDLCVRQLKGFRFIRYWGKWAGCRYADKQDVIGEVRSVINEPVKYLGYIHMAALQGLIRSGKVEKRGRDLYARPGPFSADSWPQKNDPERKAGVNYASGL